MSVSCCLGPGLLLRVGPVLVGLVQLEHPATDESAGQQGDGVVLDFEVRAHRGRDDDAADVGQHSATPGEVPPLEAPVLLLRADPLLEGLATSLTQLEGGASGSQCRAQFAHGVGDVAIPVGAPASDEPGEAVGVVPVEGLRVSGVCSREAEALDGLHELVSSQLVRCCAQPGHDGCQVDLGTIGAVQRFGRQSRNVEFHQCSHCTQPRIFSAAELI